MFLSRLGFLDKLLKKMSALFYGHAFYQRVSVPAGGSVVVPMDSQDFSMVVAPGAGATPAFDYTLTPGQLNDYVWLPGALTDNSAKADNSYISAVRLKSTGGASVFEVRWW